MVEQGDWITPHYNYEYRFQKPVFFYWMVAVAYSVAGVSETAARFPSALAGLALALMTWAIGRRWVGASAGVVGGAIVATSFGYFTIAHASLPDLPLAAFITLATWALFEAGVPALDATAAPSARGTAAAAPDDRTRRWWMLLAGLAIGFGMLTKGPVALVLPALVYLSARLVMADGLLPTRRGWFGLRWIDVALATLVLLAVALPWFLAMAEVHGTRVSAALLHRREPRALRHGALQRPPSVVVLRADHLRRPGAVVVADGAVDPVARAGAARRPAPDRARVAPDPVGRGPGVLLHALGRAAAALHPAGAAAARRAGGAHAAVAAGGERGRGPARTWASPRRSPSARSPSSPSPSCCSGRGRCSSRCRRCRARSAPRSSSSRRWGCSPGRGSAASAGCRRRSRRRRRRPSSRCSSRSTPAAAPSRCS